MVPLLLASCLSWRRSRRRQEAPSPSGGHAGAQGIVSGRGRGRKGKEGRAGGGGGRQPVRKTHKISHSVTFFLKHVIIWLVAFFKYVYFVQILCLWYIVRSLCLISGCHKWQVIVQGSWAILVQQLRCWSGWRSSCYILSACYWCYAHHIISSVAYSLNG